MAVTLASGASVHARPRKFYPVAKAPKAQEALHMPHPVSGMDLLTAIVICGLMGVLGQGIRAVVGLKNSGAFRSTTPDQQAIFSAAYFVLSLMIGFIAGVLAGFVAGIQNFISFDPSNLKLLLGIAASGYAGADFIENSMSLIIDGKGQSLPKSASTLAASAQTVAFGNHTGMIQPPRVASLSLPARSGVPESALGAALNIVAPKVRQDVWMPALTSAFARFDVNTEKRVAAAIGQFLVEAGSAFQELTENLNYTYADRLCAVYPSYFPDEESAEPFLRNPEALGNKVYANRLGNGGEHSGDGYRFRGRGLIQLTGRTEYTQFGATIGKSAEDAAAYSDTPEGAAMSGCWYLASRGCLPLADNWQISMITKAVNGKAMLGNSQRIAYSEQILKQLGVSPDDTDDPGPSIEELQLVH